MISELRTQPRLHAGLSRMATSPAAIANQATANKSEAAPLEPRRARRHVAVGAEMRSALGQRRR
eukprot:15476926-Alexandrium_andersonii.AAC.1